MIPEAGSVGLLEALVLEGVDDCLTVGRSGLPTFNRDTLAALPLLGAVGSDS